MAIRAPDGAKNKSVGLEKKSRSEGIANTNERSNSGGVFQR